ncbi:hypothetical protein SNEBB_003353 [Seison nebaliae]|nr:hypothetical protein SNEBB_003353 [Seison nebaliae]
MIRLSLFILINSLLISQLVNCVPRSVLPPTLDQRISIENGKDLSERFVPDTLSIYSGAPDRDVEGQNWCKYLKNAPLLETHSLNSHWEAMTNLSLSQLYSTSTLVDLKDKDTNKIYTFCAPFICDPEWNKAITNVYSYLPMMQFGDSPIYSAGDLYLRLEHITSNILWKASESFAKYLLTEKIQSKPYRLRFVSRQYDEGKTCWEDDSVKNFQANHDQCKFDSIQLDLKDYLTQTINGETYWISLPGVFMKLYNMMAIYIISDDDLQNNGMLIGCGIRNKASRNAVTIFDKNLKGYLRFQQSSPIDPLIMDGHISGMKNRVKNYHVHVYPHWMRNLQYTNRDLSFTMDNVDESISCSGSEVGGHHNPYGADPKLGKNLMSQENYELGDLSSKFGNVADMKSFEWEKKVDLYLSLYGKQSIIGRSIVFHRNDAKATRLTCANIIDEDRRNDRLLFKDMKIQLSDLFRNEIYEGIWQMKNGENIQFILSLYNSHSFSIYLRKDNEFTTTPISFYLTLGKCSMKNEQILYELKDLNGKKVFYQHFQSDYYLPSDGTYSIRTTEDPCIELIRQPIRFIRANNFQPSVNIHSENFKIKGDVIMEQWSQVEPIQTYAISNIPQNNYIPLKTMFVYTDGWNELLQSVNSQLQFSLLKAYMTKKTINKLIPFNYNNKDHNEIYANYLGSLRIVPNKQFASIFKESSILTLFGKDAPIYKPVITFLDANYTSRQLKEFESYAIFRPIHSWHHNMFMAEFLNSTIKGAVVLRTHPASVANVHREIFVDVYLSTWSTWQEFPEWDIFCDGVRLNFWEKNNVQQYNHLVFGGRKIISYSFIEENRKLDLDNLDRCEIQLVGKGVSSSIESVDYEPYLTVTGEGISEGKLRQNLYLLFRYTANVWDILITQDNLNDFTTVKLNTKKSVIISIRKDKINYFRKFTDKVKVNLKKVLKNVDIVENHSKSIAPHKLSVKEIFVIWSKLLSRLDTDGPQLPSALNRSVMKYFYYFLFIAFLCVSFHVIECWGGCRVGSTTYYEGEVFDINNCRLGCKCSYGKIVGCYKGKTCGMEHCPDKCPTEPKNCETFEKEKESDCCAKCTKFRQICCMSTRGEILPGEKGDKSKCLTDCLCDKKGHLINCKSVECAPIPDNCLIPTLDKNKCCMICKIMTPNNCGNVICSRKPNNCLTYVKVKPTDCCPTCTQFKPNNECEFVDCPKKPIGCIDYRKPTPNSCCSICFKFQPNDPCRNKICPLKPFGCETFRKVSPNDCCAKCVAYIPCFNIRCPSKPTNCLIFGKKSPKDCCRICLKFKTANPCSLIRCPPKPIDCLLFRKRSPKDCCAVCLVRIPIDPCKHVKCQPKPPNCVDFRKVSLSDCCPKCLRFDHCRNIRCPLKPENCLIFAKKSSKDCCRICLKFHTVNPCSLIRCKPKPTDCLLFRKRSPKDCCAICLMNIPSNRCKHIKCPTKPANCLVFGKRSPNDCCARCQKYKPKNPCQFVKCSAEPENCLIFAFARVTDCCKRCLKFKPKNINCRYIICRERPSNCLIYRKVHAQDCCPTCLKKKDDNNIKCKPKPTGCVKFQPHFILSPKCPICTRFRTFREYVEYCKSMNCQVCGLQEKMKRPLSQCCGNCSESKPITIPY